MKQETPKQNVELINDNIDEFDEKIKEFKQIDQTNPVTRGSTALVKQETLEETIERLFIHYPESSGYIKAALIGKEWQQKNSYSEEEVLYILNEFCDNFYENSIREDIIIKWFEQFKKK